MPKENTHIDFALDIAERLFKNYTCIQTYPIVYRFGAVFPDVFYYSRAAYGDCIHKGCDTQTPKDFLLADIKQHQDPKTLAFTLGYLTHYILDSCMHPAINALSSLETGFGTVYNHRWIETTFDTLSVERDHLAPFYHVKNFLEIRRMFFQAAHSIGFQAGNPALLRFLLAHALFRKSSAHWLLNTFSPNNTLLPLSYHHKPYPLTPSQLQTLKDTRLEAKNTLIKIFSKTSEHDLHKYSFFYEEIAKKITSRSLDSGLPID